MSKRAQNGKDTKNCIQLQNWQKMVHNAMHKMANEHTLAQVAKMALKLQKMHSMYLAKLEIIVCKQSAKWQHLSHKKLVYS